MPCPNHMTAMHRDACPVCNPSPTQQERDAEDAAKWRALRNCARITAIGGAGVMGVGLERPDCHVTLNFWTHNEGGDKQDKMGREWLDIFVTKAVALTPSAGPKP